MNLSNGKRISFPQEKKPDKWVCCEENASISLSIGWPTIETKWKWNNKYLNGTWWCSYRLKYLTVFLNEKNLLSIILLRLCPILTRVNHYEKWMFIMDIKKTPKKISDINPFKHLDYFGNGKQNENFFSERICASCFLRNTVRYSLRENIKRTMDLITCRFSDSQM